MYAEGGNIIGEKAVWRCDLTGNIIFQNIAWSKKMKIQDDTINNVMRIINGPSKKRLTQALAYKLYDEIEMDVLSVSMINNSDDDCVRFEIFKDYETPMSYSASVKFSYRTDSIILFIPLKDFDDVFPHLKVSQLRLKVLVRHKEFGYLAEIYGDVSNIKYDYGSYEIKVSMDIDSSVMMYAHGVGNDNN